MKTATILLRAMVIAYGLLLVLVGCMQRRLLFFPSQQNSASLAAGSGFTRWEIAGQYAGYARVVDRPGRVWLMLHGNGGQAAGRAYVLPFLAATDSVYVLEYPGYGDRPGKPSKTSINQAALQAYEALAAQFGRSRMCVLGESLGSGPAAYLGTVRNPPSRIVLMVPFDVLRKVAQEQYPFLPVRLLMLDQWNNNATLKQYKGRVDIWGARQDDVIPVAHARNLAASVPGSIYHAFAGNHDWADGERIKLDD